MNELTTLDAGQIKALIASTPTAKRAVLGKALKAACQHLNDGRKDYAKAFEMATAMRENYWHLGNELRRMVDAGALHVGTLSNKSYQVTLSDLGVSKILSSRCRKLASKKSKAELDEWLQGVFDEQSGRFPTLGGSTTDAVHVGDNTGMPEWYTPPEILDAARRVLGAIELDPASSKIAQKNVRAKRFYTVEQDGLSKVWSGNVWLNPPYTSGLVDAFVAKLCEHYASGDVPAALLLVNNATDTMWFQDAACRASAICFTCGRVKFLDQDGNPGAPLQGQAIVYYGDNQSLFGECFIGLGFCVRRFMKHE